MAKKTEAKQNSEEQSAPPPPETDVDTGDRLERANDTVQRNVYWAMGAGVLPLPIVDLIATVGVQLKMLRELSTIYGIPYREGVAKKAITSLLVGIGGIGIGGFIGHSILKSIPVIGQSLGVVTAPVVSGMLTHAVGSTFVKHFEAGGSLNDFDAKKMRKYFREEYGRSKQVVEDMQERKQASASPDPDPAPAPA